jgi:hypothetical protein
MAGSVRWASGAYSCVFPIFNREGLVSDLIAVVFFLSVSVQAYNHGVANTKKKESSDDNVKDD